jgi:hypothetical protein
MYDRIQWIKNEFHSWSLSHGGREGRIENLRIHAKQVVMPPAPVPDPPAAPPAATEAAQAAPAPAVPKTLKSPFRWQVIPWWLSYILAIYLLFKIGLVLESPCAVLGLTSPVTKSNAKQAWRKLSICTHPDKLISAEFSPADKITGEILFNKITKARQDIFSVMKRSGSKEFQCYPGELETLIYSVFADLFGAIQQSGLTGSATFMYHFVYSIVTLEAGFFNTVSTLMLLSFVFRMFQTLYGYVKHFGVVQTVLNAVCAVLIGPLPTLYRIFFTPVYRVQVFLTQEVGLCKKKKKSKQKSEEKNGTESSDGTSGGNKSSTSEDASNKPAASTANVTVSSGDDDLRRKGLRHRAKRTDKPTGPGANQVSDVPKAEISSTGPLDVDVDEDADEDEDEDPGANSGAGASAGRRELEVRCLALTCVEFSAGSFFFSFFLSSIVMLLLFVVIFYFPSSFIYHLFSVYLG